MAVVFVVFLAESGGYCHGVRVDARVCLAFAFGGRGGN